MTHRQLKDSRLSLGLSITTMAEKLNTPRGTYLKWERGERRVPGIASVALLALKNDLTLKDQK